MKITGLLANLCPAGPDCPKIHDTDGEHVIVQGDTVTDPDMLAELHLPSHEGAVIVPRGLVYPPEMDLVEMFDWIMARHTFHLLRVENRRAYAAKSDGGDFQRYLDGADEPLEGSSWHDRLRTSTEEGRAWTKVHVVVEDDLSPYERYELEWGFAGTTRAGEVVKILSTRPGDLLDVPDFWVVDYEHVVRMTYGADDKFTGASIITGADAATYRALARGLWQSGTMFDVWWESHPEMHRASYAA